MLMHQISDWDDAYANVPHIPGGQDYPASWTLKARNFRDELARDGRAKTALAYGPGERNRLDLFLPQGKSRGLVVFIHGGYWKAFDNASWSHLARGALEQGYSVAMPSYTLCPDIRIAGITAEIGVAIAFAASRIEGPIRLTGHSAGGHLASRMICKNTPLDGEVIARIERVVSISGVHDLRPLMQTEMNDILKIDRREALTESPALLEPVAGTQLVCWVGGGERQEFLRQNALLANIWNGLGAATASVEEPDRHHFNVIDGLQDPAHPLTCTVCG